MDGIEIKLLMSFMTSSGRKVSLFVTDPKEDVTETFIRRFDSLFLNIVEPEGDDLKVDINFDKVGHKRLMAKFAKLEIIE